MDLADDEWEIKIDWSHHIGPIIIFRTQQNLIPRMIKKSITF
jgi:hypothetical protein